MYKILISDDEFLIRAFLRKIIGEHFPQCEICGEAEDGTVGLGIAKSVLPDIIITDICMTEMDGLEMVERLSALSRRPQIIILTAHRDFSYAKKAIDLGVSGFILKPTKAAEVIEQVEIAIKKIENEKMTHTHENDTAYILYKIHMLKSKLIDAILSQNSNAVKVSLEQIFDEANQLPPDCGEQLRNVYNDIASDMYSQCDACGNRSLNPNNVFGVQACVADLNMSLELFSNCVMNALEALPSNIEMSARIKKIISYIENNFDKNISAQDIADYIHVSPSYLSKFFKQKTGKSPVDFTNEYRINIAKQMIDSCEYRMYEISEKVGFENAHYFAKVFRKYTGMTPSEYMNRRTDNSSEK